MAVNQVYFEPTVSFAHLKYIFLFMKTSCLFFFVLLSQTMFQKANFDNGVPNNHRDDQSYWSPFLQVHSDFFVAITYYFSEMHVCSG